MKKIEFGKLTIATSKNRQTIEKWNKLEAYVVGKRCDSLDDLIDGLYDYWKNHINEQTDNRPRPQSASSAELDVAKEKIKQIENELNQANKSITALQQDLLEKDELIQTANETIAKYKTEIQKQGKSISAMTESAMSSAVYLETAGYKRQTADIILQNMEQQIEHLLSTVEITPVSGVGMPFDNQFQKIITIQETDDPSKNNVVAESLGKGFRKGDQCLKEQEVVIYQYKENTK